MLCLDNQVIYLEFHVIFLENHLLNMKMKIQLLDHLLQHIRKIYKCYKNKIESIFQVLDSLLKNNQCLLYY